MELLNATNMAAAYTQGVDKTARELLVVVAKGTFEIPHDGGMPTLAAVQKPLTEADEATGEPGFSATRYESDFAPFKPRCDVLLNGSAYAPGGSAAAAVEVGLRIGTVTKTLRVLGRRSWQLGLRSYRPSAPAPFQRQTISYDVAFGGVDDFHPDEEKRDAFMNNPVGIGFHRNQDPEQVLGTPAPQTEERTRPVERPDDDYRPMAFGPVGRGWPERSRYAGTYDQHWTDEVFPFLPDDFDERYYQSAPEDQQCDYLIGGETVQLVNLTPSGNLSFQIPSVEVPVVFFRTREDDVHTRAVADTLIIEPDEGIFSIVWRTHLPLIRNIFEVSQVLVGTKSRAWWRARTMGKTYYPSLAAATAAGADDDE